MTEFSYLDKLWSVFKNVTSVITECCDFPSFTESKMNSVLNILSNISWWVIQFQLSIQVLYFYLCLEKTQVTSQTFHPTLKKCLKHCSNIRYFTMNPNIWTMFSLSTLLSTPCLSVSTFKSPKEFNEKHLRQSWSLNEVTKNKNKKAQTLLQHHEKVLLSKKWERSWPMRKRKYLWTFSWLQQKASENGFITQHKPPVKPLTQTVLSATWCLKPGSVPPALRHK